MLTKAVLEVLWGHWRGQDGPKGDSSAEGQLRDIRCLCPLQNTPLATPEEGRMLSILCEGGRQSNTWPPPEMTEHFILMREMKEERKSTTSP